MALHLFIRTIRCFIQAKKHIFESLKLFHSINVCKTSSTNISQQNYLSNNNQIHNFVSLEVILLNEILENSLFYIYIYKFFYIIYILYILDDKVV